MSIKILCITFFSNLSLLHSNLKFGVICNINHICITHWNLSWLIFYIVLALNHKFAFLHFFQYFSRLFLWFNWLIISILHLFNKNNRLTLFLIGWKCPVQECLHSYLVIELIQLKTVLGFQKSPYFLTSQFTPLS